MNGRFIPDDQMGVKKQGDNGANDAVRKDQYKYALGNENVIDAHVYPIDPKLPKSFGGKVWLGLGPSRNTPYVPFYGNVQDTYQAFKPQTATYDPNSWYWTVWHIDKMDIKNQDIFGKTVQDHWKMLEKQFIIDQEKKDIEYYSLKDQPEAAKSAEHKVTKDALDLSDRLFQHFKDYEKLMEKQLEAAGRKSDPYRASQPDDKQDPSTPEKPDTPKTPEKPKATEEVNKNVLPAEYYVAAPPTHDIPANAEGNPNNRFGYAATANVQVFGQTSTRAEAPQVQSQASQEPSQAPQTTVANAEGNPNNRFGFAGNYEGGKDFKNIGTFSNGN